MPIPGARYRWKLKKLSPTNKAYIAGIVDGEGCVTLQSNGAKAHSQAAKSVLLAVQMTNEYLIKWLHSVTGIGTVHPYNQKKKNSKPAWRWSVRGRQAVELLFELVPWIRIKETQISLSLLWADTAVCSELFKPLPENIIREREKLTYEMREANRRGLANPRSEISLENTEIW